MNSRARSRRKKPVQLSLPLPGVSQPRGGARLGRKPGPGRRFVRHRAREAHAAAHPLHVVLRCKLRSLRTQFVFPTVRAALAKATRRRGDFRITQFSVQSDHLHLIVEAQNQRALSRGMQGLAIRIARQVNRLVSRSGKVWADRFFSRVLRSPRVVRNALAYVLNNFRKHRASGAARIDPYSSAPYFDGFSALRGRAPRDVPPSAALPLTPRGVPPPLLPTEHPVVAGTTWLARGWRRSGPIHFADPGSVD